MSELDFFQRMLLLLMPQKHQPDLVYLRHIKPKKIHLFTGIQLICLAILFFLKLNKTISITFPLMVGIFLLQSSFDNGQFLIYETSSLIEKKVLALVFIRFGLTYIFTEKELSFLDELIPGITL